MELTSPSVMDSSAHARRTWTAEKLCFFERLIRLVGPDGFARLEDSHVIIAGIGGVGSWAAESLARSGVGHLTLADFDKVNPSNLNRQLTCLHDTVGLPKAEVMAQRLRKVNPWAKIDVLKMVYSPETSERFWAVRPDAVLDCIDNITYKCHLLASARKRGIPVVCSTGAGGRLNPSCVKVSDLSHTKVDPVALQVRKKLRRDYGFPANKSFHITAVWSDEAPRKPFELDFSALLADGSVPVSEDALAASMVRERGGSGELSAEDAAWLAETERFMSGKGRHAAPCGTSSFVTGTFGLTAAMQLVKILLAEKAE